MMDTLIQCIILESFELYIFVYKDISEVYTAYYVVIEIKQKSKKSIEKYAMTSEHLGTLCYFTLHLFCDVRGNIWPNKWVLGIGYFEDPRDFKLTSRFFQ